MKTKLLLVFLLLPVLAIAQTFTFTTLANFNTNANPWTPPIVDSLGNLYGVASGGTHSSGIVYKVTFKGVLSTVYNFTAADGVPVGWLTLDQNNNLYGMTTGSGGTQGWGIIFRITSAGKRTTLYKFPANSWGMVGSLGRDSAGNLYGTGNLCLNCNTSVFKLTPQGVFSTLYTLAFGVGTGSPILDASGNLYCSASSGGTFNYGYVFKITSRGKESVLYNFTGGTDGGYPSGKLNRDSYGNVYGGAQSGGAFGNGVVYKIDSNNNETVLYSFAGDPSAGAPYGLLNLDSQGNVYGIASGGPTGDDEAFELTLGHLTELHSFGPELSAWGLAKDTAGNLYGASPYGGTMMYGSIYKLTRTN